MFQDPNGRRKPEGWLNSLWMNLGHLEWPGPRKRHHSDPPGAQSRNGSSGDWLAGIPAARERMDTCLCLRAQQRCPHHSPTTTQIWEWRGKLQGPPYLLDVLPHPEGLCPASGLASHSFGTILTPTLCQELQKRKSGPSFRELQVVGQMGATTVLWDAAYQVQPGPCQLILSPRPTRRWEGAMEERMQHGGWEAKRGGLDTRVNSTAPGTSGVASGPLWSPWGHSNTLWT